MLYRHAKKIKKLYDEINDNQTRDMKIVHAFGTELNKAKEDFEGRGWQRFVTDDCKVNKIITARRAMRIARMLTVKEAVEAGSIDKAYLKCREIDKARNR